METLNIALLAAKSKLPANMSFYESNGERLFKVLDHNQNHIGYIFYICFLNKKNIPLKFGTNLGLEVNHNQVYGIVMNSINRINRSLERK